MTSATPIQADTAAIWCVIPVHNNAGTIAAVVAGCLARVPQVLVVDDGITDADLRELLAASGATVIRHPVNRGKGAAILTALGHIAAAGGRWMITIDGDGQHDPRDLEKFLPLLAPPAGDDFLVIGQRDMSGTAVPGRSRFGMNFSDGWVRLETGISAKDTQSGFRAYPVRHLAALSFSGRHYDFEIEAIVRLLWGGVQVRQVPISVWYPEPGRQRVTSFRPIIDNALLTHTHAKLFWRNLFPWPHQRLAPRPPHPLRGRLRELLHPLRFLNRLLRDHATPGELGIAAGVGIFLGVLPLIFCHTAAIVYAVVRLRLNAVMALTIQTLCAPPFVPIACILLGHFMRCGKLLGRQDCAWDSVKADFSLRLWEWLLGSLVLAPAGAIFFGLLVHWLARRLQRQAQQATEPAP
jgi:glycosyltransferase involved in cell wall biosynthesis